MKHVEHVFVALTSAQVDEPPALSELVDPCVPETCFCEYRTECSDSCFWVSD